MNYIVYKTTNLVNGKEYIGIHQTNDLNDGYLGSGIALINAIKKYGKDNFKRDILLFCNSYEELLVYEAELVNEQWINNENNYNLKTGGQQIGVLSDESKLKISNTLKEKYASGEIEKIYGARYEITDEQKQRISDTLKERYKRETHPTTGVEPWNKGKKGVQTAWNKDKKTGPMGDEQKHKISETLKAHYIDNSHKNKGGTTSYRGKKRTTPVWNTGIKMEQIECPYCGKLVDRLNGSRWHFENCKHKNALTTSVGVDLIIDEFQ